MTTRLYLVRHGETDSNRQGLALGRADPPLNDLGRRQAERLALALAHEEISVLYSSPLGRTRETAARIGDACRLEVRVDESLIEMDVGDMDGLELKEVRERYPGFIERWLSDEGPQEPMPGGERLVDVQSRAESFLELAANDHADERVVAVTHNFVILTALATVLMGDLVGFRRLRHGVAAISVLEMERGGWRVTKMNDACHLDGL
jgi:broad specificity phosphatase PhoE